jgi:hypothetical protein
LIEWLLVAPWQGGSVRTHRTDTIPDAIAGDGNRTEFVGAPNLHALLCQDVQDLWMWMAEGIIGTRRDNPNLRLYLLYKSP